MTGSKFDQFNNSMEHGCPSGRIWRGTFKKCDKKLFYFIRKRICGLVWVIMCPKEYVKRVEAKITKKM